MLQAWAWGVCVCVCVRVHASSERLFWWEGETSMEDVTREATMELAIIEVWDFMHHERWDGSWEQGEPQVWRYGSMGTFVTGKMRMAGISAWVCLSSWEMMLERGLLSPYRVPQVLIPPKKRWWIPDVHFCFSSCSSPEAQRNRRKPVGHGLWMSRSATELVALYVILINLHNKPGNYEIFTFDKCENWVLPKATQSAW